MSNISTSIQPNTLPYVVSADAGGLMQRWADVNGLSVPSHDFFRGLSIDLGANLADVTGAPVEVVSEDEMRGGLGRLVCEATSPVISLDRAYIDDGPSIAGFIDATRAVREHTSASGLRTFSAAGLLARPGQPSVTQQMEGLRTSKPEPVTLVDDVIFAGDGAIDLAEKLAYVNRPVEKIIAGIGIAAGVEKIQATGIEVECVRIYDNVMDEVCERDFLAGVPMSGRTVVGENGASWSAPYFQPYGNPEGWASIPADKARDFSRFCLEQSIEMWVEVERISGVPIPAQAIPRVMRGNNGHSSITMLLREDLAKL